MSEIKVTTPIQTTLGNGEELYMLIKKAVAAFNALTPEEQAAHRREQTISWVKGEMLLSRWESGKPDLSEEDQKKLEQEIADIYDRKQKTQEGVTAT